jgi:hypothetical protein
VHSEFGQTPLERFLAGPSVARECPGSDALRDAFRVEVKRKQRRSDGTVSLEGQRFEIPSGYRRLEHLHLRYARWDFSRVDLIDARTGQILCPIRSLDKAANADALHATSPVPASSNVACGFPALRFPVGFLSKFM